MTSIVDTFCILCARADLDKIVKLPLHEISIEYLINGLCELLSKPNLDILKLDVLLNLMRLNYTEVIIAIQFILNTMKCVAQIRYIELLCCKYSRLLHKITLDDRKLIADMILSSSHDYKIHLVDYFVNHKKIITREDVANVPKNFMSKPELAHHFDTNNENNPIKSKRIRA